MYDWLDTPLVARTAGWLFTYAVHGTVLLALAGILARWLAGRRPALEETLWRGALVGGLLTASLPRLAAWWPSPAAVPAVAVPVAAASPVSTASGLVPVFTAWAVALWAVVAAAFLVSLAVSWWRLHRRLAPRRAVVDGPLAAAFEKLRRAAGERRRVRLTTSAALSVPVAFGLRRPEICLPERAARELSPGELAAVLSHELAHLVRRDPAWRLLARVLAGVFFFQPFHRLAARRLERLSEVLCDDWAVTRTGRAAELARCLAEVAGWTLERPRLFPVPGIADGRRELEHRVRRLLDRGVDRRSGPRRRLTLAVAAALLVTAWLAPTWTVAAGPAPQDEAETRASDEPEAADEAVDERDLRRLEAELRRREETLREQEVALRRQEAALREQEERIRRQTEEIELRLREREEILRERLRRQEEHVRSQAESLEQQAAERAEQLERQVRELEQRARQVSAEERERESQFREQARELEERVRRMVAEQREHEESLVERARELEERARRLAEEEERREREESGDEEER